MSDTVDIDEEMLPETSEHEFRLGYVTGVFAGLLVLGVAELAGYGFTPVQSIVTGFAGLAAIIGVYWYQNRGGGE